MSTLPGALDLGCHLPPMSREHNARAKEMNHCKPIAQRWLRLLRRLWSCARELEAAGKSPASIVDANI